MLLLGIHTECVNLTAVLIAAQNSDLSAYASLMQAGLFIVQLLYPTSKVALERRQESIKLGILEVSNARAEATLQTHPA
jgi:hypothetical protein